MKITVLILRSLLGIIYLVFGFNFFFHFMPVGAGMPEKASAFMGGLIGSGYFFQYMKVIEILSGFFLLINRYTAFFLVVLFPITLNIFLFHTLLAPMGMPVGIALIAIHLFLGYAYRKYYSGMFTAAPVV